MQSMSTSHKRGRRLPPDSVTSHSTIASRPPFQVSIDKGGNMMLKTVDISLAGPRLGRQIPYK